MNNTTTTNGGASSPLPTDKYDRTLSRLIGLPNGAHTQPAVTQDVDYYGNVAIYTVQTVKWDEGHSVFITKMDAEKPERYVLPPKVIALMSRQADSVTAMIRRRHGRRLAEQRKADGVATVFTPAMRAKALATRRAKAAKRKARRASKGGAR